MVSFWDASAVVALFVVEPHTTTVLDLAEQDGDLVVWWGTRVECTSALARRSRSGPAELAVRGRQELQELATDWVEIEPSFEVREAAERLLWVHPLRAADALQLAAALRWCDGDPREAQFVSLDQRLRDSARIERFTVLPDELG